MTAFHERLRAVQRLYPDTRYRVDVGMLGLPRFIEQFRVDLDPDYQRGYVWTLKQKKEFVGSVLQSCQSIPIFWFNWKESQLHGPSEVVDGKQRINAILGWIRGDYEAVCPCGEVFHSSDIDEIGRRNLDMMTTLKMHFVQLDRLGVLRFYLSLNSGGTVHKKKDLTKVQRLIEEETNVQA